MLATQLVVLDLHLAFTSVTYAGGGGAARSPNPYAGGGGGGATIRTTRIFMQAVPAEVVLVPYLK